MPHAVLPQPARAEQHLTGEWRGAHDESAFRALLMLPFTEAQISTYLKAIFPNQDVRVLLDTIASVHNLREMAGRPFTLKLIARFLPRIEQWRAQGRKVSGVTLYREVTQDWLMRDIETLDFLGQMLDEAGDTPDRLRRLGQLREPYTPQASELLMRYGQLSYVHPSLMIGRGHAGRVIRCGFSLDGTRIISTSTDRSQRIWDAASAECLSVTQVHEGWAQPGALSPDGTRIVTTYDRSLLLWDAASGERLRLMQGHEDLARGYAYSPNGARIVSGSQDGSLRLWDSTTGECLRVMGGRGHFVMSCAFSADGARIVSTSDDGSVRLWGAVSGECLCVLQLRDRWPQACAAFSPDGVHVVSGGHGGQLRLWDAASGECLRAFSPNDRWPKARATTFLSCFRFTWQRKRRAR